MESEQERKGHPLLKTQNRAEELKETHDSSKLFTKFQAVTFYNRDAEGKLRENPGDAGSGGLLKSEEIARESKETPLAFLGFV